MGRCRTGVSHGRHLDVPTLSFRINERVDREHSFYHVSTVPEEAGSQSNNYSGHYPPGLDGRHKSLEVLRNEKTESGFFETEVKCDRCLEHCPAKSQLWIWSFNYRQDTQSDDIEMPIQMHSHYGSFELGSGSGRSGNSDVFKPLSISPDRQSNVSVNLGGFGASSVLVHGALMALVFALIFPFGGLRIRKSFLSHIWIQMEGLTVCIIAFLAVIGTVLDSPGLVHIKTSTFSDLLLANV